MTTTVAAARCRLLLVMRESFPRLISSPSGPCASTEVILRRCFAGPAAKLEEKGADFPSLLDKGY